MKQSYKEVSLKGIAIIFGMIGLWLLWRYFMISVSVFTEGDPMEFLFNPALIIACILFLLTGILLWRKKIMGWMIANAILLCATIQILIACYSEWQYAKVNPSFIMTSEAYVSFGIPIIVLGIVLMFLNIKGIRSFYSATLKTQALYLMLAGFFSIVLNSLAY